MNIIFLFSGQARTFPFSFNRNGKEKIILESYNKFIFTEKFKKTCNYKIYITTDDIHLHDTITYFNEKNIGNIHLLNPNYYKKKVNECKNIEYYLNNYNNNIDWSKGSQKYNNSIHQHYKLMDCYNLFKNDNITNCDYIVRLRLDIKFNMNLLDILENFKINPALEIIIGWDLFAIGKPTIMECYCNGLNNNYGKYKYYSNIPNINDSVITKAYHDAHNSDLKRWEYAPEMQLFQILFEYCNKNKLNIKDVIMELNIDCNIIRY